MLNNYLYDFLSHGISKDAKKKQLTRNEVVASFFLFKGDPFLLLSNIIRSCIAFIREVNLS